MKILFRSLLLLAFLSSALAVADSNPTECRDYLNIGISRLAKQSERILNELSWKQKNRKTELCYELGALANAARTLEDAYREKPGCTEYLANLPSGKGFVYLQLTQALWEESENIFYCDDRGGAPKQADVLLGVTQVRALTAEFAKLLEN